MRKISEIMEDLQRNIPIDTVQGLISKKVSMDALKINTGMKDKDATEVFDMCGTDYIYDCVLSDAKEYLDKEASKNYSKQVKILVEYKFEDSATIDKLRDDQENPKEPDMEYLMGGDDEPLNSETHTFEWSLLKGICNVLQQDPDDIQCVLWYSEKSIGDTIYKCIIAFKNDKYNYDDLLSKVIV
jgi:hypothetical protein